MVRQRERARHNEASALANAEQKATLKARITFARRLKAKGMDVKEIIELTDLSVDEVLKA